MKYFWPNVKFVQRPLCFPSTKSWVNLKLRVHSIMVFGQTLYLIKATMLMKTNTNTHMQDIEQNSE